MESTKIKARFTGQTDENFQTGQDYELEVVHFSVKRTTMGDNPFKPVIYGSVQAFLNNWTAIHVARK